MKITFGWLREFLDSPLNYKEIIAALESLGFETKKVSAHQAFWEKIEIVKIIDKKKHGNSENLNLYSFEKKNGTIITVVCGDESLQVNDFVPYAMPGTTLPSGLHLQVRKIRGIDSPGMLCSPSELEFPAKTNGVLRCFEEDWGKNIAEAYETEAIFEIELTPNRGDALSILGVARILANSNFGTLKEYQVKNLTAPEQEFFEIQTQKCKALHCSLFQYEIKNTPAKIAKRLFLTDHSVINLDVVDLTNYISHAIGQPMHVFDYDKIKSENCVIKLLENEEEFITLANQTIKLNKETLVFKAGKKIISWPSVIGGENSKTEKHSVNILLETGIFESDPLQRRKHGVITSAAKRSEYGLNPFEIKFATNTFFNLLGVKPIAQQYIPFEEKKTIPFNFAKVKEILGSDINFEEFKVIMQKKDFIFNEDGTVTPPNYKFFDITTENCIVEEFAIGLYSEIKSINLSPRYPAETRKKAYDFSKLALACGFNECRNIALGKKEHEDFGISLTNRLVQNYSNQNYAVLRGSLIPDLLKNMSWHINNQQKLYKFFEHGLIYGDYKNKQTSVFTAISNSYADLQKLFAKILSDKSLAQQIQIQHEQIAYSQNSSSFFVEDQKLAIISSISQPILKEFHIKECFALEIFADVFNETQASAPLKPSELSPIYQDITISLKKNQSTSLILNFLNTKRIEYQILSVFPENDLNQERKITIQLKFSPLAALTKEQINASVLKISEAIQNLL